ncbi:hypothetical protein DF41_21630 [Raoultella planticola]|nr:hypothetical protein DF41_21630 [Raoultella planticola]
MIVDQRDLSPPPRWRCAYRGYLFPALCGQGKALTAAVVIRQQQDLSDALVSAEIGETEVGKQGLDARDGASSIELMPTAG